jgi:chromate transport protein ChrA
MEKNDFDVPGVSLILIATALFVYYSIYEEFIIMIVGLMLGIIGIIFIRLSQKTNNERAILSGMLLLVLVAVSMVNIPKIIAGVMIIICGVGALFVILKPPNVKKEPAQDSTVKQ